MKKLVCISLVAIILCGMLSSCKSPAEKELERAQKAAENAATAYENALNQYDDLKSRLDSIEEKTNALFP